jgi:hypothetical protein
MIGEGEGKKDAVVMVRLSLLLSLGSSVMGPLTASFQVNFAPFFVAPPGKATTKAVADHVEHIAKVAGKRQYAHLLNCEIASTLTCWIASVGIGSDFDGIDAVPVGLEDVSHYPNLVRLDSMAHALVHAYAYLPVRGAVQTRVDAARVGRSGRE